MKKIHFGTILKGNKEQSFLTGFSIEDVMLELRLWV